MGLLCFGFLTFKSFAAPVASAPPVNLGDLFTQSIEYDYRVYPVESTLYPVGTEPLVPGPESFYAFLTERVEFQVTGSVMAEKPLNEEDSRLEVSLALHSGGQWKKELSFKPEVEVSRLGSTALNYSAIFDLPLEEAKRLGEAIMEEVQGRSGGDGFNLLIESYLSTDLAGSSLLENKELHGEYEFAIDSSFLRPQGELRFENSVRDSGDAGDQDRKNVRKLPVYKGSSIFPVLFIFFGMIAGGSYLTLGRDRLRKMSKRDQMVKRIRKHYGSRLAKAGSIRSAASVCLVEITDYRELSKIADEVEKPILEVIPGSNLEKEPAAYYVPDGKTLYCFKLNQPG